MPSKILLVEDEADIAALIRQALSAENHEVVHVSTAAAGWTSAQSLHPALIILDIGLPDDSGINLCKRIRSHPVLGPTPIIILTAKGNLEDKMEGFEAGADHYLIKPFQIQELHFWTRSLLKRITYEDKAGGVLKIGDFVIDPQTHRVQIGSHTVANLTRKEFDLLYLLAQHRPKILSKEQILSALWHTVLRDNTVEVHIKNLRAKLGPASEHIATTPGVGYHFI